MRKAKLKRRLTYFAIYTPCATQHSRRLFINLLERVPKHRMFPRCFRGLLPYHHCRLVGLPVPCATNWLSSPDTGPLRLLADQSSEWLITLRATIYAARGRILPIGASALRRTRYKRMH